MSTLRTCSLSVLGSLALLVPTALSARQPLPDFEMGIMDFEGNWHEIRTYAESNDPECPYEMQTLDHHLIAAHDCDDLVVISRDGKIVFSHPTGGTEFILSTIGSDQYLAESFGQSGASGFFVRVYNLKNQQPVLWLSLAEKTAFYSVSPSGSLALVESGKLKLFESSLVADCRSGRLAPACMAEFSSILPF